MSSYDLRSYRLGSGGGAGVEAPFIKQDGTLDTSVVSSVQANLPIGNGFYLDLQEDSGKVIQIGTGDAEMYSGSFNSWYITTDGAGDFSESWIYGADGYIGFGYGNSSVANKYSLNVTDGQVDIQRSIGGFSTVTEFRMNTSGAIFDVNVEINGSLNHDGGTVGFYGTVPTTQQNITGSRGGNVALADLLTKLALTGIITDSTTV